MIPYQFAHCDNVLYIWVLFILLLLLLLLDLRRYLMFLTPISTSRSSLFSTGRSVFRTVAAPSASPSPISPRLASLSHQFSTTKANMAPITKQYDCLVIGGGSGGSGAARRASGWYKAKTAIIDDGISGGCCVNVGYAQVSKGSGNS